MLAYVSTVLAFAFQNEGHFLTVEALLPSEEGLYSVEVVRNILRRKQMINQ